MKIFSGLLVDSSGGPSAIYVRLEDGEKASARYLPNAIILDLPCTPASAHNDRHGNDD